MLLSTWLRRLAAMFRKRELDTEFDEELRTHVAFLQDDWERRGLSPEEALFAARRSVGNFESHKELVRDTRGLPMIETFLQDLRYTFRTLRRDIGFAFFAISIAGLGIGASVTVFSVVNALLIRPLPFTEPSRLVWIANHTQGGLSGATTQVDHMRDLQAQAKSLSGIAAYFAFYGKGDMKLAGESGGEPARLSSVPVSCTFFPLLGVEPLLGRSFTADECSTLDRKAVMLSYPFWKRHFNGDSAVLGRKLILNDQPREVVGVLPESFDFGAIFAPGATFEVFEPFPLISQTNQWGNTMAMVGRLAPGATVPSAQAEITVLARQLMAAHPQDRNDFEGYVTALADHVSGGMRPSLGILVSAVCAVMLIVCANLSSLLLGRNAARRKELAVRAALGAGRARLVRQMLTESMVLSFAGAALGLLLAFAGTYGISHIQSLNIPLLDSVRLDTTAILLTVGVALLTGLGVGVLPAIGVRGLALHSSLKDSSRGTSTGRSHAWIRKTLVSAEVAFACLLLIGSGLLIRSLFEVLSVDLGFRPDGAATIRIDPDSRYKTQQQQNTYFDEALRLVRGIPGVTAAGLTDCLPLGRNRSWGVGAEGAVYPPNEFPDAFPRIISEGYFRSLGVPLHAGRDFTECDTAGSEPVVIINETLARTLWPGKDPLGKRLTGLNGKMTRVVGVVSDVRHLALEQAAGNEMYFPIRQSQDRMGVDLVVRSSLTLAELASRVRQALLPVEPNLPAREFRSIQSIVDLAVSPRWFLVAILAGFAGFALLLAALGIYAVISYTVGQRTQEIGIRLALGASAARLQRGIVMETLSLAGAGMLVGIAGAWAISRWLGGLLFGVKPTDPGTFAMVLIGLLAVAVLAGFLPARRVMSIDASTVLRAD